MNHPRTGTDTQGTILVVDDAPASLHLLSLILNRCGYQTQPATDGAQALALAQATLPDLILLDIMMPGMDGYQVCERLKADERTRDIPVLFLSALGSAEDKVKAFATGGVDYITKPFQADEVVARVATHLALRNVQKGLAEKNAQLQREIAERQRADEALHHYAERLKILHEIDQAVLAARMPETIAVAAIQRIRQLIPCQRAVVMSIEGSGQIKLLAAESERTVVPVTEVSIYRELFQERTLTQGWVHGVENLAARADCSPLQQALYDAGMRSFVTVPLFLPRELVGILSLESDQPQAFIPDHIAIATEVAALLAVAIRQVRLYERAQQELAERMQAEARLRHYTAELREHNAELDAFAHTVAHDLKTPLAVVIGYAEMLEPQFEQLPAETLREFLYTMSQRGRKMNRIIDELLLLSSVRGLDEVKTHPLDMGHIVAEVCGRLRPMIQEKQAEIVLPDVWPVALGYAPWVEEVWANYLSNAIKYGGRPPRIHLGFTLADGGSEIRNPRSEIKFWVRDNGPGLTPEEQARLFAPFERLHQVRAEGHGLGLSIVRRIVEKLGGKVGVESEPGQGSLFFFTLPA